MICCCRFFLIWEIRGASLFLSVNFKEPEAVRALTCTLLKEDFGLTIQIPLERLIPTVPLRLNYIHWVEDLIDGQKQPRRGIDIGTAVVPSFVCWTWAPPCTQMQNVSLCFKLGPIHPVIPSIPSTYKPILVTACLPFCHYNERKHVPLGHQFLTFLLVDWTLSSPWWITLSVWFCVHDWIVQLVSYEWLNNRCRSCRLLSISPT